jgi:hypothetical protein
MEENAFSLIDMASVRVVLRPCVDEGRLIRKPTDVTSRASVHALVKYLARSHVVDARRTALRPPFRLRVQHVGAIVRRVEPV